MFINAFFTKNGIPQIGLSPTMSVWKIIDNTLLLDEVGMSEVGGGFYKYNFVATQSEENLEYAVRCFGGELLPPGEQYTYATFLFSVALDSHQAPVLGFN